MKAVIYPLLIVVICLISLSCGTEATTNIDTEKAQNLDGIAASGSPLPPEYKNMLSAIVASPNEHERNATYANRVGKQLIKQEQPKKAIDVLKRSIIADYEAKSTRDNIVTLLDVYRDNPKYRGTYIDLVQSLQEGNPNFTNLDRYKKDIPKDTNSATARIEEIRNNLTDTSTGRLDLKKVNEFVNLIEIFVMVNPDNKQSPVYLKLAAEVLNSIKVYPRAIEFYDWTLNRFPNSPQAAQALFMKGFTLDDGMKKKKLAKPVYEEFLRKYPKNDFADDTKFLLENINKSDEEIIKQFEKKDK